jgi:Bacteriophage baseplate protein W
MTAPMIPASKTPRPFLGQGLRFPLEVVDGKLAVSRGEAKIAESIRFLISTARGERAMRPMLGCGLHDLVFAPGNSQTDVFVADAIRDILVKSEPRIDVLDINVERPAEEPNLMLIRLSYRIRENNAVTNLVYPFFVAEGTAT